MLPTHTLRPVDADAIYRSSHPDDPRLGNLLLPMEVLETSDAIRCAVLGVPQHIGVERNGGRPGSAEAPSEIRRYLYRMATAAIIHSVEQQRLIIADLGDVITGGKTLEQIHDEAYDVIQWLISSQIVPIVLGGGHDTAWPTLKAYGSSGQPFGVINVDAHADVRPLIDDTKAHSGSPFRQVLTDYGQLIPEGSFIEYGLQETSVSSAHLSFLNQHGAVALFLRQARGSGAHEKIVQQAAEADRFHVSLDMDAFASAYAPGVSAPSSDGFMPHEIAEMLREAARNPAFRSFDVVEVSPPHDVDGRTSKLAATMIMQVLAGLAER